MKLDTLIFFVTSTCNSKCRTCFYWKELNARDDLSFAEIERVSRTMPAFRELWLSGGEPTLREELVEIVALFYRQNGVRSINLPANGLSPEKLRDVVESALRACPELRINLNLALDGIGATHDGVRGVPGNFERALASLDELQTIRRRDDRLRLHANSVVCRENLGEMVPLGELLRDRFRQPGPSPPLADALHRRPDDRGARRATATCAPASCASGSGTSATTTATGAGSGTRARVWTRSPRSGATAAGAPTSASSTRA